jgi:amidase
VDNADLAFAGITRQAELIRSGETSSRELVELSLERIERIDPQLNSFRVVMAERALTEADQADARRKSGDERPLLGVPIAVKDNLDVPGEVTTHGSSANETPATRETEVVRRLRAAGAIVVGKTTLSELAIWPQTETKAWGITRNPWDTNRTPGGSSGGSAAAVAAGLVGGATASDGGGSIRIPAACCGLFGLKPQRGRVPLTPDYEHWHGLSVYGGLTRTVEDSALWLAVVANEPDVLDAAKPPSERLRIAVSTRPSSPTPVKAECKAAVHDTADLLRGLGHTVTERNPSYGFVLPHFFPRYTAGIRDDAAALEHPERLESPTKQLARIGELFTPDRLAAVRRREAGWARRVQHVFDDADVLLIPSMPHLPLPAGDWPEWNLARRMFTAAATVTFMSQWNVTGQPAAAVPAGFTAEGLPLSIQLVGRPGDERTLLALAAQLEAERPWADRRPALAA